MNLLLNEYADNPIIDEVVYWPPKNVLKIIAKDKPLGVEVVFSNNTKHFTEFNNFDKTAFMKWWQEATQILKLVTTIDVVSEVTEQETMLSKELSQSILERREQLIDECVSKIHGQENDEFTKLWFFEQFGFNCANLPKHIQETVRNAQENT